MWKSLGIILFVIFIVWLAFRSPDYRAPQFGSPEERAAQTKLEKEQEDKASTDAAQRVREQAAKDAERQTKFAAERATIIAKAKQLNAAQKYSEVVDIWNNYAGVNDAELNAQTDVARAKVAATTAAKDRAQRKKEGVAIGMTADEVLQSSWGRPQSVNKTHTARGTHEQWVYPGSNYLYFDDGVVTAVQN